MRLNLIFLFAVVAVAGTFSLAAQEKKTEKPEKAGAKKPSMREIRKTYRTKLLTNPEPVKPPAGMFDLISYKSPAGSLAAYISPDPKDGKKHPVILWLIGGFSNSISEESWEKYPSSNDQSAAQYRNAGLAMMYPSLRGGNNNPGNREGYFGEVDDVIAAAEHAAKLPWVDPSRIYLGGHSTGGTLALLVAGSTDLFRAVISFEPVHSLALYGQDNLPFDVDDRNELYVRAPILYLPEITSPTFIFGGDEGNIDTFRHMRKNGGAKKNVQFHEIPGADHFCMLKPFNEMLAKKVLADDGKECAIAVNKEELKAATAAMVKEKRESNKKGK
ncbi:MAG TPA: prolyl oligopeptidase family serine peptidase [Verrucomicrobiales bacterium]|jgi:dipeptidyl aminopeptidase/acylaminoacyl peptidase|nr:prolyl oligopeptidase family serine peptidase [Verrucomicrobiales bacterium]